MKLDQDFLKIQSFANKIFESLPVIKDVKNDKDLINQLQYSCVCYGRKLVSLFDKYQVLQKRISDQQNAVLVTIAQALNTQPNPNSIIDFHKRQLKQIEQLNQKIEYLENQQPPEVYQRMLSHEQSLTSELQAVIDRLIKEIKLGNDDKQAILDELRSREEQIKSLTSDRSPIKYNSAQKHQNVENYRSNELEQTTAQMRKFQETAENLHEENEALLKRVSSLSTENHSLKQQNDDLESEIQHVQKQSKLIQEYAKEKDNDEKKYKSQITDLNNEYQNIKQRNSQLETENQNLKNQIHSLKSSFSQIEQEYLHRKDIDEQKIQNLAASLQGEVLKLRQEIDDAQHQLSRANVDEKKYRQQIQSLEQEMYSIKADERKLKLLLQHSEQEFQTQQQLDFKKHKQAISSLEQDIQTLKQEEQRLKVYASNLESELKQQKNDNNKLQQLITQLEQEFQNQKQEVAKLVKKRQTDDNYELTSMKDKISVLEFENMTYKEQIRSIESDIKAVHQQRIQQEQNSQLEVQNLKKQLEDKKKQAHAKVSEQKMEIQEQQQQLQQLQDENQRYLQQLQMKNEEIHSLNKTFAELEDFSRKQIDVIKSYEDKLVEVYSMKKNLEKNYESSNSKVGETLHHIQKQNRQLQEDNERLINDIGEVHRNYQQQIDTMEDEFKAKSSKQQETNKDLKEQLQQFKKQIDKLTHQLKDHSEQDKAQQMCKQLNSQLTDIKQKMNRYDDFTQQAEVDEYRRTIDALQEQNANLLRENQQLQLAQQKQIKISEMNGQVLNSEVSSLKNEIKKLELTLDNERLSPFQSPNEKSKAKNSVVGSAFYENLIETKDQEINRLAGVVRSLTESRRYAL